MTIAFFKTTCPVCQLTFPFLERLHRGGAARQFGISQDDAETTREFNQEFGVTLPMLFDTAESDYPASNAYGSRTCRLLYGGTGREDFVDDGRLR